MILLAFASLVSQSLAGSGEWKSLFDGKTLDGWIQKNGTATYRVEDSAIVGQTTKGSPNSFLCTEKEYGDFELEFEVKLINNELNSGVQIRTWINGEAISDLTDTKKLESHPKGFIGLQVHGVGNRGPYKVIWRNLRIKSLDK
jgi:hypothetical protein